MPDSLKAATMLLWNCSSRNRRPEFSLILLYCCLWVDCHQWHHRSGWHKPTALTPQQAKQVSGVTCRIVHEGSGIVNTISEWAPLWHSGQLHLSVVAAFSPFI